MVYNAEQTRDFAQQQFAFLLVEQTDHCLTLTLNRPAQKNALHPVLVNELAFAFSYAHHNPDIWVVVLAATGNVFCAGADLKAFMQSDDIPSSIPVPAEQVIIGDLFKQLHKPCIANIHAPVYAGGLLLVGGCTHVIAAPNVTFALPEVKRGIFPFQVMESLLAIMPARKVLDWCMRAQTLTAADALQYGLVTQIVDDTQQAVADLVAEICQYAPLAISKGLKAYSEVQQLPDQDRHRYLYAMLMETLSTEDAMEGIMAFQQKRSPVWKGK